MIEADTSLQQQQQQQQYVHNQQISQIPLIMNMMSPDSFMKNQMALIGSEHFPDILQFVNTEQATAILDTLAKTNNPSLVNKQGASRGYTALHWICVRNECELIEHLVLRCRADPNIAANLGETPLFICIKYRSTFD